MGDHYSSVSQGGEGVPRRSPSPPPKAPPAAPDDWRVEQLLSLYPEHDAPRWVQQMVGWQRRSDAIEAELQAAREALGFYADEENWPAIKPPPGHPNPVVVDRGKRARAALKGDEDG